MKHLFNLNQLSMNWRGKKKSQNAEGMWGCYGAETVTTSESAYIQHTLSIHSAYIGTSREAAGKKVKSTMGLLRYAAMLLMVLTLGVGQMWGADYYLRGGMNSWNAQDAYKFSSAGSNTYTLTVNLNGNYEFKISDNSWNNENTFGKNGSNTISLGTEYTCKKPGDGNLSLSFSSGDYTFTLNTSTCKLTIVETPAGPSVSLGASPTSAMCGEDITFTATPADLGGASATYKFEDITSSATTIQAASSTTTCTHSWTTAGTKTVRVTMATGGNNYTATKNVTVKTCYVRGSVIDGSWNPAAMTYATDAAGDAYYYYQSKTGAFKVLVGNSDWNPADDGHQKNFDNVNNSRAGADIILTEGLENSNIDIGSTGYIIYYPEDDEICATSDRSKLGVIPSKNIVITSVSPTSLNSGGDVTIVATPTNTTNTITLEYTDDSGAHWYSLSPKTSSVSSYVLTATWTIPVGHDDTKTYNFRAKVVADELTSTASSNVKAYGIKTIKVKDTHGWGSNFKIHRWGGDAGETTYPGVTTNITSAGGQWKQVVLYSSNSGFLFCNGVDKTTADNAKTVDISYSNDVEDDGCYVIGSPASGSTSFTEGDCPSAPTVSTNNITTYNLTSATLGGNITDHGNDIVSDYGYYYSTNSALSSSNLAVGTKVSVGTDDKDGSYSQSQTGLSVGTTYYVLAYATNPHGTGYGTVESFSTTAATLSLEGTVDYEAKTMTITPTTNMTAGNGFSGTYYVCCTCTSKPGGADDPTITWNGTTKKLEISDADTDGDYTFNVKLKPNSNCSGDAFNNADEDITITKRTIPDRSGLTINHAKYNGTYMNGNGTSGTPYFIYLTNASSYGKLNLTATLPAALLTGEGLYYSVNSSEIGAVTVDGTSASVTMDLPNKTVGADRTAAIKFYSKLDGQVAPSAKMASLTVYYTVNANPIVTVSGTYNGNPIAGEIPQNAEITVSASVTQIPGEPTFVYKKGSGEYSATTSYTIESAGTTTMYAKTSYLGEWTGTLAVTTYAANPVTLVTKKTDMYGDIAISSTSRVFRSSGEEFSAPDIDGYTFSSWSCTGDNVRVSDDEGENWVTSSTNQTVYVKATAAGSTLTANYTEVKRIYFDNTNTNWDTVHIILFTGSSPWSDSKGVIASPNNGYSGMTRIGQSDIYYYEYGATTIDYVAFTEHDQHNYDEGLYNTKAAFRGDFSECNPCYVAPADKNETKNGVDYFSDGYWRRYMPQYSPLSIYLVSGGLPTGDQGKFEPENKKIDSENFTKELLLAGSTTYYFNLPSSCGGAYGNNGIMTKDNCTNWTFEHTSGSIGNCRIETTAEGTYIFRLSTANGQVKLSVEYPLSEGDYRIAYTDATGNNDNYSNYIRQNTGESAKNDTVSFYVKTSTPKYQVQQCSGFDGDGKPEWDDVGDEVAISVSKDSVYYFVFQQPAGGASISQISQGVYSGNYYIRTDGVAGGWANYLSNPDNKMTHTDKASALATGYDYYKVKWIGDANGNSTTNVKFVIANDYNNSLSQEFGDDPAGGNINPGQALTGKGANVRFTWNASTNEMSRAYIGGSGHDANYLMIDGDNLKKSDGSDWAASAMSDQNDWIYTIELKAADDATIQIQSHYNNTYVTVLPKETVLIVSDANYYDLRIVYDYKTNEIVAAYIPSTVSTDLEVDVDIMFIRKAKDNHEDAPPTTLNLVNGAKITGDPKTLYGAIEFEKAYVRAEGDYAGLATRRPERSTYWISFPFNVRVKDIFGLGEYTDTWILQRYRGDRRAQIGWFLDTPTFWEYILDTDYVLEAGQGYVLSLDCEAIQWPNNRTTQYLYFPSKDKIEDITSVLPSASMNVPEHECTITSPADRTIKDSHWNVIGIPGFTEAWGKATETVSVCGGDFHYFYTWNPSTNTLSSASTTKYEFQFMHSYMVQYSGNIDWLASEPAGMPALQAPQAQPEEVEFRLAVLRGEEEADHTFITLMTKENITSSFDMNSDLVKMENANKTNIYTIINNDIQVAANCLPMSNQTTVVNVGVKVAGAGEYTFAMPDGTDGIGVTLIDNETGEYTNLGLTDYTVNLNAGSINDRFVLEISPVSQTTTDIEEITGNGVQGTGVRKVMIDGILYIVRDGQVFDARGARVQ